MKIKTKKYLLMALSLVLVSAISIIGTIAFLIDGDSKVNTFTVGDISVSVTEDTAVIGEGGEVKSDDNGADYTEVMPGDYLKKEVKVANTGTNPAYVAVTVTLNNALEINKAIDVFYEGKGYSDDEIQAIYDSIFDGFGMNYNKYDEEGNALGMRLTITGDDMPEKVMQVDSVKTIDEYALFYKNNWFGEQNDVIPFDGYYTKGMNKYEFKYTYYMLLNAGEETVLFNGLNIPETFNKEQLAMFAGLNIDIEASAIQADNFYGDAKAAFTALKEEMADGVNDGDVGNVLASPLVDTWDGTVDTSWYNETDTTFTLNSAEQLAGIAELVDDGNTFEGKTIKLSKDINLDSKIFEPIGSYRKDTPFMGIFDGQGHIIKNLSQNTWALDNGYEYGDLGLGFFGKVRNATIKNLTMDNASISGESAICGTVAATAYGECAFDNITVKNSKVNDYQYYAGGVVGWASGTHTYKNINIEASTVIGSQWGDFGNANGGIIGGAGTSGTYHFEDCTVACRIDATNDVVSAYQWYNYRNSGMLIGQVGPETIVNEVANVTADNVTCKNVTVIYGDWANYTYCEFAGTGYPYVRVQAGVSVDAYSNVRYGHPTDANGNIVVDDNHVHNDGEAHHELIAFDQLFGGPANHRYCYYGISAHPGVTVIYNNK